MAADRRGGTRQKARPAHDRMIEETTEQLRPVLHRLARQLKRQAVSAGVSSLDHFLLGMIKNRPGIGVTELARMEDTTRPTMSSHIKRLRNAGWIEKGEMPTDADQRRSKLVITSEGLRALASVRKNSNEWLSLRLAELPDTDLATLRAALPILSGLLNARNAE